MSARTGQRVAVLAEDGFYYLATVTTIHKDGVDVDYDDETHGFAPTGAYTEVELPSKYEHPLTADQLDGMLFDAEPTGEETKLAKIIGEPSMYRGAQSPADRLRYLKRLHKRVNEWFFDGALPTPIIKLIPDRGVRARMLGQWWARNNTLRVGTRLFNAPESYTVMVLVHEICHQAVSTLVGVRDSNGGHGPNWCKYMKACGLTPSRYFHGDMTKFFKQDELHERAVKNELTIVLHNNREQIWPKRMQPAMSVNAKSGEIEYGVIVCPADKQGKRWAFYTGKETQFRLVPAGEFYAANTNTYPAEWGPVLNAIATKYDK